MNKAYITFKAKIIDGYIKVPTLKRRHCNMDMFRVHVKYGAYANSDLFEGILARIRKDKFLGGIIKVDNPPEGIYIDDSKFLAKVEVIEI